MNEITLDHQKELIELINKFESMPIDQLKNNIKYYTDKSGYKLKYIASQLQLDIETIYSWRQPSKNGWKIDFVHALKLCNFLEITIDQLMGKIKQDGNYQFMIK